MQYWGRDTWLGLIAALLLILLNLIVSHFLAPIGLLISPIVVLFAVCLISFTKDKLNPIFQALITYMLLALDDIGLKIFAGGIHDAEGQGVINLMLCIGVVICFFILLISVFKNNTLSATKTWVAIILFLILAGLHIKFFGWLGLAPRYL